MTPNAPPNTLPSLNASSLRPGLVLIACLFIALGCDAGYEGASAAPGAEGAKSQDSSSKSPRASGSATTEKNPKQEKAVVRVHVFNDKGELVGPVESPRVVKSDAEWRKQLTPEQYRVVRSSGTERPFCGLLLDNKKTGVYTCVACGLPLFTSESKFNSGTGWPSFYQTAAPGNVAEKADHSYGMTRVEINCARCDGHLGHVFEDGPRPTGLRYCLNSESLSFTEKKDFAKLADPAAKSAAPAKPAIKPNAKPEAQTTTQPQAKPREGSKPQDSELPATPATPAAPAKPQPTP
jgi:methionine-R-sulfoxide reductase